MNSLEARFALEAGLREIDDCKSLDALKALAKSLLQAHYASKTLLGQLILQQLPKL
jgi:hypothetical protein